MFRNLQLGTGMLTLMGWEMIIVNQNSAGGGKCIDLSDTTPSQRYLQQPLRASPFGPRDFPSSFSQAFVIAASLCLRTRARRNESCLKGRKVYSNHFFHPQVFQLLFRVAQEALQDLFCVLSQGRWGRVHRETFLIQPNWSGWKANRSRCWMFAL
jgi:hypothetical protein